MSPSIISKLIATFAFAAAMLGTASASQIPNPIEGPRDSGGGHYVDMPDGSVVLADRFSLSVAQDPVHLEVDGTPYYLSDELKTDLKRAIEMMRRNLAGQAEKFAETQIFDRKVSYYLVNELPNHPACRETPELKGVPQGARVYPGACTVGSVTVILANGFNRMSRLERTKLILHERLRNWHPPMPLIYIAAVTEGVGEMLTIADRQSKGENLTLSPLQIKKIYDFLSGLANTKLSSGDYAKSVNVLPNGGGLEDKDCEGRCVHPEAVLGVGAVLSTQIAPGGRRYPRLEKGAMILNSSAPFYLIMEEGAVIVDSSIQMNGGGFFSYDHTRLYLGPNARIEKSELQGNQFVLRASSKIEKTRFVSYPDSREKSFSRSGLDLGTYATISESSFDPDSPKKRAGVVALEGGAKIERAIFRLQSGTNLTLKQNAQLLNVGSSRLLGDEFGTNTSPELIFVDGLILDFQGKPMNSACPKAGQLISFRKIQTISSTEDFKREGGFFKASDKQKVCE